MSRFGEKNCFLQTDSINISRAIRLARDGADAAHSDVDCWLSQPNLKKLFEAGLPDFSWSKHTKTEINVPNARNLCRKTVNYTKGL
jgi:hypothetical protein